MQVIEEMRAGETSELRSLADKLMLRLGAAVDIGPLGADPLYAQALRRQFNTLVAENIFKPYYVWSGPHDYRWDDTDRLAQFAAEAGMALRGHTLVWHQSVPSWLWAGHFSPAELRSLLRDYIHAMVGRYRGQILEWDVVNEAVSDGSSPGYRESSFWFQALGPEYIDLAFQWAHEADPDVRLYYNDYEAENMGPKANAVYDLAKGMLARGVPIHGVGLQCHLINGWRAAGDHRRNIRRIVDLGLSWAITECDIRMELNGSRPTEEQLAVQADGYADLIDLCLTEPGCQGFLVWGFTDRYSWIPDFRPGWGAALPLDEDYRPKPAFRAMEKALGG